MLMPRGMVPQLQIGRHMPVSVVQRIPESLVEPIADFCILSGPTNSWITPATKKLNSIQADALFSMLMADKNTSDTN